MSDRIETTRRILRQALSGRGAHALAGEVFDGLACEPAGARPDGAAHTIFQILNHLVYWQDFALRWLAGGKPETPERAALSWPGGEAPADAAEWEELVERYRAGLAELDRHAADSDLYAELGPKTALEILQLVASHNSYHGGQVAALRRALGAWPPPGGGATW